MSSNNSNRLKVITYTWHIIENNNSITNNAFIFATHNTQVHFVNIGYKQIGRFSKNNTNFLQK